MTSDQLYKAFKEDNEKRMASVASKLKLKVNPFKKKVPEQTKDFSYLDDMLIE